MSISNTGCILWQTQIVGQLCDCFLMETHLYMWMFYCFSLSQWTLKKKFERLIFPIKYVIPKSLKFSHWQSKALYVELLECSSFQDQLTEHKKNDEKSGLVEVPHRLQLVWKLSKKFKQHTSLYDSGANFRFPCWKISISQLIGLIPYRSSSNPVVVPWHLQSHQYSSRWCLMPTRILFRVCCVCVCVSKSVSKIHDQQIMHVPRLSWFSFQHGMFLTKWQLTFLSKNLHEKEWQSRIHMRTRKLSLETNAH